jgi:hypothetical protein
VTDLLLVPRHGRTTRAWHDDDDDDNDNDDDDDDGDDDGDGDDGDDDAAETIGIPIKNECSIW